MPSFSLSPPHGPDATTSEDAMNPWTLFDFENPFLGPPLTPPLSNYQPNALQLPPAELVNPSEVEKLTGYVIPDESFSIVHQQALVIQDVNPIRDRWLYPVISAQTTTCNPNKSTVQFYGQILKTYPQMTLVKDQLPPIIHPWQLSATDTVPVPLGNCFSLIRMWEGRSASSSQLIDETLKREMNRLFNEYRTYTDLDLLATLQALLLYAIMAFFSSASSSGELSPGSSARASHLITPATITHLQQVAYRLTTTGTTLLLPSEHPASRTLPTWEDWITVSAKRRTILALYCFHCVFNCMNNLPTFPCDELKLIPAPAGKVLWSARDREGWERAYYAWWTRWSDIPVGGGGRTGGFMMGEMMRRRRRTPGDGGSDERLQRWLSEVDEFGMMIMVVVHGASQ